MVDAAFIDCFRSSLSSDGNIRVAAELQLKQAESQDGMLSAVLNIIASNDQVCDTTVKMAAAIYFKNRVHRAWTVSTDDTRSVAVAATPIPALDKAFVKQHILNPVLFHCPQSIKFILKTALGSIIYCEDSWPELLPVIQAGLASGSEDQVEGSLMALVEVFKKYRYITSGDRTVPNALIEQTHPVLVNLGSHLLQSAPQPHTAPITGRVLHLIFKVYRLATQFELSTHNQQSIVAWGTLFLQVVNRQLDAAALPKDEDDRQRSSWWKAKKWAYFNLNRLFTRYGSPSQLPSNMQEYAQFASTFEHSFAPEIFKAYLKQVELSITGQAWLSPRCTKHTVDFLEECVKPKSTWALLRPQLSNLLSHFLFPLLCPSDDEIQSFTDDPVEYAKSHSSEVVQDYYVRADTSVLALVDTLTNVRNKIALQPLLAFANSVISDYPAKRGPKELEGALKLVAGMAIPILQSKTFGRQMEGFFESFIFPLFQSEHGFLRARACQMVEVFEAEDIHWENSQNVNKEFEFISAAMQDSALPVRISAATALPELVRYKSLRDLVAPSIGRIMQDLLALANEVDLDIMSDTTRKLVDDFSEELVPFSEQLSAQMSQSYLRILQEGLDARTNGEDDGSSEDKALVALGTLKTLQDLIASLESSPEILARLESQVLPACTFTLQHEFTELYDEIFEIVNTLTYHQRRISPLMWRVFELFYATFKSQAIDFIDEMFNSLDNFISFGPDVIGKNESYVNMLLDIYNTTMTSFDLGASDRSTGCKLAESMLLNMRGMLDQNLHMLLTPALSIITRENTSEEPIITPNLYLYGLEVVVNGILYNPILTIQYLDSHKQTQAFFHKWAKKLSKFSRVHDRKLGISAVCAILASLQHLPTFVDASHQFVGIALRLFADLPDALILRKKELEEYEGSESEVTETELDDTLAAAIAEPDDDAGDEDFLKGNADYEDYLRKRVMDKVNGGIGLDGASEASEAWADEVLWDTPLDRVDVYAQFTSTISSLERDYPATFQTMVGGLDSAQKTTLHQVVSLSSDGGEAKILSHSMATTNQQ